MRVLFFIEIVMLTVAWFTIRLRVPPAIDVRDKSKGGWAQVKWIDLHAFRSRAYMMIVIGLSLTVFGLYTPFVSWFFTVLLQDPNLLEPADVHERLHFVL
jgi:MCP family monocarboxylic acid transporter-like MFS transporter 10